MYSTRVGSSAFQFNVGHHMPVSTNFFFPTTSSIFLCLFLPHSCLTYQSQRLWDVQRHWSTQGKRMWLQKECANSTGLEVRTEPKLLQQWGSSSEAAVLKSQNGFWNWSLGSFAFADWDHLSYTGLKKLFSGLGGVGIVWCSARHFFFFFLLLQLLFTHLSYFGQHIWQH